ncbi:MAG: cyclase/dehydrase [Chthoniobacterales bacterium]|nr:MAG: cyclase/dehydrase [Chthoniobacterales bacterium]
MNNNSFSLSSQNLDKLATGLGWFSIALGAAEILAPRALSRLIGFKPRSLLLPALGLREITSGLGILNKRGTAGWLWSRVAGDAMDLALLGAARLSNDADENRVDAAGAAVLGVTALDIYCAIQHSRDAVADRDVHVRKVITVDRPPQQLYAFWRKLENLPRVMRNIESVRITGENRSHWTAIGPGGARVEWDAEITGDRPDELIAWQSLPGADVENYGSVRFEPASGRRGTMVRVSITYTPPAGNIGQTIAKMMGRAAEQEIQVDLYRFKQIMETGQITSTDGQPAGRPSSTSPLYDAGTTRG